MANTNQNLVSKEAIITMKKDLLEIKKNGVGFFKPMPSVNPKTSFGVPAKSVTPTISAPLPKRPEGLSLPKENLAPRPATPKPIAPIIAEKPVIATPPTSQTPIQPEIKKDLPTSTTPLLPKPPQAVFSSFGSELMVQEPVSPAPLFPKPTEIKNEAPVIPVVKPEEKPTKSFMEEVEELMAGQNKTN